MSTTAKKILRRSAGRASDAALGIAGGPRAAAAATFGIVMTLHGPSPNSGKSRDFTVFAQLAPRPEPTEVAAKSRLDELDLTTTASIPQRSAPASERAPASAGTLQAASADAATILLDGRRAIVHVGDRIPGIGEVLAIVPGTAPMLRTTGGVITASLDR